ncbi:hypothetical protein KDI_38460 [Dictyobacter arantiisoli]|uniref:Uncharacterized protein n=1 Tax=Dictyobacter arantiisoli TaxID=2014874 RepID=A0A5A5TFU1_9CHLR|nr:hypothetical protein KDI_38460 [Dictyobacter arantiisoli]
MRDEARRRCGEDILHQLSVRASHWYEMHAFLHEAINAALSAWDYEQAALLIARSIEEHNFPDAIKVLINKTR